VTNCKQFKTYFIYSALNLVIWNLPSHGHSSLLHSYLKLSRILAKESQYCTITLLLDSVQEWRPFCSFREPTFFIRKCLAGGGSKFLSHVGKTGRFQTVRTPRYFLSYLLTPWSRVLFGKLTGSQLVKQFPAFYGIRRFITAFTSARQLSLSWASSIHSIPPYPTSWTSILKLSSHLRLDLHVISLSQVSQPKPCKHPLTPDCINVSTVSPQKLRYNEHRLLSTPRQGSTEDNQCNMSCFASTYKHLTWSKCRELN